MRPYGRNLLIIATVMLFSVSTGEAASQKTGKGISSSKDVHAQKDESLRKGERRATLDPGLFNEPRIRRAYQIAQEIPWVLDSIHCYCMCAESPVFKHKSLLSCYVDTHAAA
ncbi:MAG: PCYCGC domain-containing protein [Nitrospirae bacterium]|nr:PCYCGC domain-containing protein [Nitrospirota bacterium]MCL5237607.1 PCYCGC domain-containing protein [Nitrospirota bacterium]